MVLRRSLEIKVMIMPTEKIKRTKEDKEAKQKTEKKTKKQNENRKYRSHEVLGDDPLSPKARLRVITRWQTSSDLHRYIPWEY